jgi:tRNA G10  N-methylase Trm11
MIADEIAVELSARFVRPGNLVLDPFCGTGRTLLAATERGAEGVGVDVNPLAILVARAKASRPSPTILSELLSQLSVQKDHANTPSISNMEMGRKVEWFSSRAKTELSDLINWINDYRLGRQELFFIAAILSATVREVSYCRDNQWKLHRMPHDSRNRFFKSPWVVFERRLRSALRDLTHLAETAGALRLVTGDARKLSRVLQQCKESRDFDLVLTSPPYGDSRTTVQYGGMSGICLGVLRHVRGLEVEIMTGGEIDRRCLGGSALEIEDRPTNMASRQFHYWHGGIDNPARRRVLRFMWDLELCCKEIGKVLKRGAQAVFVVARRSVGGWRLNLDRFLIEIFAQQNMVLDDSCTRRIQGKMTPNVINRHGRAQSGRLLGNRVCTMREEHILVFRKV